MAREHTAWGAVALVTLAGAMASAQVGKLPPALPLIRADLGMTLVQAGFVVSLFNVLGMSIAVLTGGLAERAGRLRLVGAGFVALVLGGVLGALAPGQGMLMASRLIEGLGFVAITVSLPFVMAAASAPRDRGLTQGFWSIYHPLGMALAMLSAPVLLGLMDWRAVWGLFALACVLMGLATWAMMRRLDLPPPGASPFLALTRDALRHRPLQVVALVFGAYAFQWATLMAWLPTFLTEDLGLSLPHAGLATALVVLVNVPGCLFGGVLARRGATRAPLILTGTAVMAVCALGLFLPGLPGPGRIALAVLFSFAGGLIPPALFDAVPRLVPSPAHIGAGNGMLMQGSALGQFIGAPLVAWAVAAGGGVWAWALAPMLGAAALTALGGLLSRDQASRAMA